VKPLLTEPGGRNIVIYAVFSWALGILWLRRMARVDF
jgi:Flp pilus assembly protein TadB